jgi:HEAT repeat protein
MTRGLLVVTLLTACRAEPTETAHALELLRSHQAEAVTKGIYLASDMRRRERSASKSPLPLTAGEETVVKELQHLLSTGSNEHKEQVAYAFEILRIPGSQPELIECARKEPLEIAQRCVRALGEAADPANVEPLVAMLADPTIPTEWDAKLQRKKPSPSERVSAVRVTVADFGDAAVPALAQLVRSDNAVARELALVVLDRIGTEMAAEAALPALNDPDQLLRYWAILAIEPSPRYWPELKPLLDDPEEDIREEARKAMAGEAEFSPKPAKH